MNNSANPSGSVTPSINLKVRSPGLRANKRGFKIETPAVKVDDGFMASLGLSGKFESGDVGL